MKKYKDEITSVAGLAAIVAGAMIAAPVIGVPLLIAKIVVTSSIGIIGYFTGKEPKKD
jgi:phosphoribosylcarboxyaminoimidazole (NCAIR) mutase